MKKTYSAPALADIRLKCTSFLMVSGGGQGNEGDDAESKRFWGNSIFEDDDEEEVDFDY